LPRNVTQKSDQVSHPHKATGIYFSGSRDSTNILNHILSTSLNSALFHCSCLAGRIERQDEWQQLRLAEVWELYRQSVIWRPWVMTVLYTHTGLGLTNLFWVTEF